MKLNKSVNLEEINSLLQVEEAPNRQEVIERLLARDADNETTQLGLEGDQKSEEGSNGNKLNKKEGDKAEEWIAEEFGLGRFFGEDNGIDLKGTQDTLDYFGAGNTDAITDLDEDDEIDLHQVKTALHFRIGNGKGSNPYSLREGRYSIPIDSNQRIMERAESISEEVDTYYHLVSKLPQIEESGEIDIYEYAGFTGKQISKLINFAQEVEEEGSKISGVYLREKDGRPFIEIQRSKAIEYKEALNSHDSIGLALYHFADRDESTKLDYFSDSTQDDEA